MKWINVVKLGENKNFPSQFFKNVMAATLGAPLSCFQ